MVNLDDMESRLGHRPALTIAKQKMPLDIAQAGRKTDR